MIMAWWKYVFVFVYVLGNFPQEAQTDADLRFTCKDGWMLRHVDCYLPVNVAMTWGDAQATCKRQGGKLLYIINEIEFDEDVQGLAPQTEFWTGLKTEGSTIGTWDGLSDAIELCNIPRWAPYEPDTTTSPDKNCVAANIGSGLMTRYCDHNELPFICKYPACVEGYVSCANGEGCVQWNQLCDGISHCTDASDERSCPNRGNYYDKLTSTGGQLSTNQISEGVRTWVMEAPIGKRIRLTIPQLNLEEHMITLEVLTGSPNLQESVTLKKLTGNIQQQYAHSSNNFMAMRLQSDISGYPRNSFTVSWTTDIAEIPEGVTSLTAIDSWRTLTSPFFGQTVPLNLRLRWTITAAVVEIITYYVDGTDSVYVRETNDEVWTEAVHSQYVATYANVLHVEFLSNTDTAAQFTMKYQKGCTFSIDTTSGKFSTPGFIITNQFPHSFTCDWTLTGGADRSEGPRGMSLKFLTVDMGIDINTDSTSEDIISVRNGTDDYSGIIDAGTQIISADGTFSVMFQSDVAISGRGLHAEFYVLCAVLELSAETTISTTDVTYGTLVSLSCPTGYAFNYQEYYHNHSVDMTCGENGMWSLNRIPECQVVQCGSPPAIDHAYLDDASGTIFNTIATYICYQGFSLQNTGPATGTANCNEYGEWTSLPVCQSVARCSFVPNIANGGHTVVAGSNVTYDYETVVEFYCNEGYEIHGLNNALCEVDGTWSFTPWPTCEALKCPLPDIEHKSFFNPNSAVEFGDTLYVYCETGYVASGTSSMVCQSNQTFDVIVNCTNINECDGNPCGPGSQCTDSEGSYSCDCLPGFQAAGPTSCQDVGECSSDNGGCDHTCTESVGNYTCSCDSGYRLFANNGDQGFYILTEAGETGTRPGDTFRLGHTCVPVQCLRPMEPENGKLLSNKATFHYDDIVTYRCNDGYHISSLGGHVEETTRYCGDLGWNGQNYTCSVTVAPALPTPEFGNYDSTVYEYGDDVTLDCRYTQTSRVTVTGHVIYNNSQVEFGGEDITRCPAIDCGDPYDVLPNGAVVIPPTSTLYLNYPSFGFSCQSGYEMSGQSGDRTTTVRCDENGRWTLGTLTCIGQMCSDPGTPGDAVQIADSYEMGSTLRYSCSRTGFTPVPSLNYTCRHISGTTVVWSDGLAPDNLPTCTDTEPPVIQNCPQNYIFYPMDVMQFTYPQVQDNLGVKRFSFSNSVKPGDRMGGFGTVSLVLTAEDFSGLTTSCTVSLIQGGSPPLLNCPDHVTLQVTEHDEVPEDLANHVSSDGNMTFSPGSSVIKSVAKIGTQEQYSVTAVSDLGENYCTFMVNFEAGACFEETLYQDDLANRTCQTVGGGMTCTSMCKAHAVYPDGATIKTFTCTGNNIWNIQYPNDFCLPYIEPDYSMEVTVIHLYEYPSAMCLTYFDNKMNQMLNTFRNRLLGVCGLDWIVTAKRIDIGSALTEFKSTLILALEDLTATSTERILCTAMIQNITSGIFELEDQRLTCTSSGGTITKNIHVSDVVEETALGTQCSMDSHHQVTSGTETLCVPCGPGRFYNASTTNCEPCTGGSYQNTADSTQCETCPTGQLPDQHGINCLMSCPAGFYSGTGIMPCEPCQVDTYWVNATTCTACDVGESTVGVEGVTSSMGCYEPCPIGHYSRSGYRNLACLKCPQNFYQNLVGQTHCSECADDEKLSFIGSHNHTDCTPIDACTSDDCSGHGTCRLQWHRAVCYCDEDYTGATCQTEINICDFNPCKNGATCVPDPGGDNTRYSCVCRTDLDVCQMVDNSVTYIGDNSFYASHVVSDRNECASRCDTDNNCFAASYTVIGSRFCFLYETRINPIQPQQSVSDVHMIKECTQAFGGSDCERDLSDDCSTTHQCNEPAMCKDKIGAYECVCPASGEYEGIYCSPTVNVCSPDPCNGHGRCNAFGSTRHQCVCNSGYTGINCEVDIDECDPNPCLYGGECRNFINSYQCVCINGFTGTHCQNPPDFCARADSDCQGNTCYNSIDDSSAICQCTDPYYAYVQLHDCEMNIVSTTLIGNSSTYNLTLTASVEACKEKCLADSSCLSATYTVIYSVKYCSMYDSRLVANEQQQSDMDVHMFKNCATAPVLSKCTRTSAEPCDNIACEHGGTCVNNGLVGKCLCPTYWTGARCQHNIDDCMSSPCVHGQCIDGDYGNTSCTCDEGYTGNRCETNINDCVPNPCGNNACEDIINGHICHCSPGFEGDICQINIDECSSAPCHHGGTCVDLVNDYRCVCADGWQGKDCSTHRNFCYSGSCLNDGQCFNTASDYFCRCYGGSQGDNCGDLTSVCRVLMEDGVNMCVNRGVCQDSQGSAKCNCPQDYAGAACELIRNECSDNPCQNGGTCYLEPLPTGHRCDCRTGYSGASCQVAQNPCVSNPCVNRATCHPTPDGYICMCAQGQVWSNNLCEAPSTSYCLLVVADNGRPTPMLRTPFSMITTEMSVMMRIRVFKSMSGSSPLLTVLGSSDMSPTLETAELVLQIDTTGVNLTIASVGQAIIPFNDGFGGNIADGLSHHVGVSVGSDGTLSCTIDAMMSPALPSIQSLNVSLNFQVMLGEDMVAAYSSVTVWTAELSNSDFSRAYVSDPDPDSTLAQGWWNYDLTSMTRRIAASIDDVSYEDEQPTVPMVCDNSPFVLVTDQRVTPFANLPNLRTRLEDMSANETITSTKNSFPADFTWGYYGGVAVGFDANNNYAECRFPLYIKYHDTCPSPPVHRGEYSNLAGCGSGSLASPTCVDSSKVGSAPLPLYQPCGVLGVYDWMDPAANLVLPTCGPSTELKYIVNVKTEFSFSIPCQNVINVHEDNIKNDIRQKFMELTNTKWHSLCSPFTDCGNLEFSRVQCRASTNSDTVIHIDFTLHYTSNSLQTRGVSATVDLADAFQIIILIDRDLNLMYYAAAQLQDSALVIDIVKDCADSSMNRVGDRCVSCGLGMYYDTAGNECRMCPRGQFQNATGQQSCHDCDDMSTTVNVGTTSSTMCVDKCLVGNYFSTSQSMCVACPRHFYQDLEGQNACKPCKIGFKTQTNGSVSESDCHEDCPAGMERTSSGQCAQCGRGYWRSLLLDDCTECPQGRTTLLGEMAVSESSCVMEICALGQFFNLTSGTCVDCSVGYYQDTALALACKPCPVSRSTTMEGADNITLCQFYCEAGYMIRTVNEITFEDCVKCPRGTYKVNTGNAKFGPCIDCAGQNTTDIEGAETPAMCNIPHCTEGQYINETTCVDCPLDQYQVMDMPTSQTTCTACPLSNNIATGTNHTGSVSHSDCLSYCDVGMELQTVGQGRVCRPCPRESYKDNLGNMRFEDCISCGTGNTTDGTGAISESMCNVPKCVPGQYIVNGVCTPCDKDHFSEVDLPTTSHVCTACPPRYGIAQDNGANNRSLCTFYCDAGMEVFGVFQCMHCPRGAYKDNSNNRFGACLNCSAGLTTDLAASTSRDNCSVPHCTQGQYVNAGVRCEDCPLDTYQDMDMPTSHTSCTQCPDIGTTSGGTNSIGTVSVEHCMPICNAGKVYKTATCQDCDVGTYKLEVNRFATNCTPCIDGYTTDGPGKTDSSYCTLLNCQPGTYLRLINDVEIGCEPCAIGTYSEMIRAAACTECTDNRSTAMVGANSESLCQVECGPGKEGNESCELCQPGYYKVIESYEQCTKCPPGWTSNENRTFCPNVHCEAGKRYDTVGDTEQCIPCDVGTYKGQAGNTDDCIACPNGTTTSGTGLDVCDQLFCVPGKTVNATGDVCVTCEEGKFKTTSGNDPCTPCPSNATTDDDTATPNVVCDIVVCNPGSYRPVTVKDQCILCPANTYEPNPGSTECTSCPPGHVTSGETGQTALAACVPHCGLGEEFISNACSPCAIAKYKDAVGNVVPCTDCPPGKTTAAVGSTSQGHCSYDRCPPGSHRVLSSTGNSVTCAACAVNTYQQEYDQAACEPCIEGMITMGTAKTHHSQCVAECGPGWGYLYVPSPSCQQCKIKWYNNNEGSDNNLCKMCPAGWTSVAPGQISCDSISEAPFEVAYITLSVVMVFDVQTDCARATLDAIRESIQEIMRTGFAKTSVNKYRDLCSQSSCTNIVILNIEEDRCLSKRRRKRETPSVVVTVEFGNIPDVVTLGSTTLPSDNLVVLIIENNRLEFSSSDGAIQFNTVNTGEVTTVPVCGSGDFLSDGDCVPCAVGHYWEAGHCLQCPRHTYQDTPGQTSCTACSDFTFTITTGSTSVAHCKSYCDENRNYCNYRGTCEETGHETAECVCNSGYSGTQCQSRSDSDSDTTLILALSIGCGGGLLLLILVAVGIFKYMSSSKKSDLKRLERRSEVMTNAYGEPVIDGAYPQYPGYVTYQPGMYVPQESTYDDRSIEMMNRNYEPTEERRNKRHKHGRRDHDRDRHYNGGIDSWQA